MAFLDLIGLSNGVILEMIFDTALASSDLAIFESRKWVE
jgi:hypothetical protein